MGATPAPMSLRVIARNFAAHEDNPLHDPDRVHTLGWERAAIPGAATFGYLCQPLIDVLGHRWFEGYRTEVRFVAPVHDGDELDIRIRPAATGFEVTADVAGRAVATMNARPIDPDETDPATPTSLATTHLDGRSPIESAGSSEPELIDWRTVATPRPFAPWRWVPDVIENAEAAAQVEDHAERYRTGIVHPHVLLRVANQTITRTYRLPHWLHVGSVVDTVRAIQEGDVLRVDASVIARWQSGRHQFIDVVIGIRKSAGLAVTMTHRSIVNFGVLSR